MYIRGHLQIFTHVFTSVYLYRVGKHKKPDGDLTNLFCLTDSYYVHKIMKQIEKGENTRTCEAGQLS